MVEFTAIVVATGGDNGPARGLAERLTAVGVEVELADSIERAGELAHDAVARGEPPPVVIVDLRFADDDGLDTIRGAVATIPGCMPIAVTAEASARLAIACVRAGACDVIDLALEGSATARAAIRRVAARQAERMHELSLHAEQGAMVEELLKELIRTERRSIDVEEALAHARSSGGIPRAGSDSDSRGPSILLVEHDRAIADELADLLEAAGIATFAYVTGEEALRDAPTLAVTTGLDLALVAAQLPGIDGLEAVRRLREGLPGLPAFLMTSIHDAELAADAADLGVVGFVHKPLTSLDDIVARLAQLARESLQRSREHTYLERIKERHERVLERYRTLRRAH